MVLAILCTTDARAAPATFSTGFSDAYLERRPDRDDWLRRIRGQGAQAVRVQTTWADAAPDRPPTWADARNPVWGGYRFSAMDDQVRRAVAAGLEPMLLVTGAPAWAEGPGRPPSASSGSWKPSSASFGRFMQAVAARYTGRVPDPADPTKTLPRVRFFQLWNEPNLEKYLAPQFAGGKAMSPDAYRGLQNAGYAAVKRMQPDATVVTAGTSPFGDSGSDSSRMRPAAFWRRTLCLDEGLRRTCRTTLSTNVLAHHPYPTDGAPSRPAYNRDDISVADIPKLTRIIVAARKARTVGPGHPAIWVTEFGVRSNPPAPVGYGVRSLAEQARFDAEATWRLWRDGVSRLFYFTIVDEAGTTEQPAEGHGVFASDGTPKPSARATRFPVYGYRGGGRLRVWTRPPLGGRVRVEAKRGGAWTLLGAATVRAGAPLSMSFKTSTPSAVRAVVGQDTSYVWTMR